MMTRTTSSTVRVNRLPKQIIPPQGICLHVVVIAAMIAGCDDSLPPRRLDNASHRLLADRAMFVTDDEGHAMAAWLGCVKVYPPSSPPIGDSTLADLIALPS